jgi:hypothetical protein
MLRASFRVDCHLGHRQARAQRDLLNWINVMLPVQSSSQKYSGSLLTQITSTTLAIPAHIKGRFAIVTNVRSGCDGRRQRC